MPEQSAKSIEVCFSPALFEYIVTKRDFIVVIIDVLRATTSFCAALDNGADAIIPLASVEEARKYKENGYLVAGERDGSKIDFADFGNSPSGFTASLVKGRTIAYTTTNGTQAIEMAKGSDAVVLAAFTNLNAIAGWLIKQPKNVVLLCSGWKNTFSAEDAICAGALTLELMKSGGYRLYGDSSYAAYDLWNAAKIDLLGYVQKVSHYQRLEKLGLGEQLPQCFAINTSKAIPVWNGEAIIDLHKENTTAHQ
jgi:2-phosphosulfolactate phosphatase